MLVFRGVVFPHLRKRNCKCKAVEVASGARLRVLAWVGWCADARNLLHLRLRRCGMGVWMQKLAWRGRTADADDFLKKWSRFYDVEFAEARGRHFIGSRIYEVSFADAESRKRMKFRRCRNRWVEGEFNSGLRLISLTSLLVWPIFGSAFEGIFTKHHKVSEFHPFLS